MASIKNYSDLKQKLSYQLTDRKPQKSEKNSKTEEAKAVTFILDKSYKNKHGTE